MSMDPTKRWMDVHGPNGPNVANHRITGCLKETIVVVGSQQVASQQDRKIPEDSRISLSPLSPLSGHFSIALLRNLILSKVSVDDQDGSKTSKTTHPPHDAPIRLRPLERRSLPGKAKSPRCVGARHLMMS